MMYGIVNLHSIYRVMTVTLHRIMEISILRVGVIDVAPMSSPTLLAWPPVSTNFRNRSHFTVVPCHSLQKITDPRCYSVGRDAVISLRPRNCSHFLPFFSSSERKIAIKRLTETMPSPDKSYPSVRTFVLFLRPVDARQNLFLAIDSLVHVSFSIRIESISWLETVLSVMRFNEWKITCVLQSFKGFFFFRFKYIRDFIIVKVSTN